MAFKLLGDGKPRYQKVKVYELIPAARENRFWIRSRWERFWGVGHTTYPEQKCHELLFNQTLIFDQGKQSANFIRKKSCQCVKSERKNQDGAVHEALIIPKPKILGKKFLTTHAKISLIDNTRRSEVIRITNMFQMKSFFVFLVQNFVCTTPL